MADIAKMIVMECITNLHVGDGDINYNIIDNEVQKDPLTKLPTIHSSGIKGAFRAFCESNINENSNVDWIKTVFGSDPSIKKDNKKNPGELKFFGGNCLALAMRNSGMDEECEFPFSLVTTKNALQTMTNMMDLFNINDTSSNNIDLSNISDNTTYLTKVTEIEGVSVISKTLDQGLKEFYGKYIKCSKPEQLALLNEKFFDSYQLPVVARYQFENMISKNLWYEEFVPHHSVFYTFVRGKKELVNQFCNKVHEQIVQFGANASIGYGLMRLSVVGKRDENEQEKSE